MVCRRRPLIAAFAVSLLLFSACSPQIVTVTVTTPPETVVVTATPSPVPSPTPLPPRPKVLTVCLVGEPDTLYLYGGSRLAATRHVMEALYDGPVDHRDYAYQPVILQKVPRIADRDVRIRDILAREGDLVVDARGEVVELAEGVRVRPTGCYDDDCAIEFEARARVMERMEITFVLREDVAWADGEPLTADDSLFAFEVASDSRTPGGRYLVERTASYRMLDEWRVKWVGLPGFLDPDYATHFFAPLPRHQLEGRSAATLLRADETRRSPLGWGPFVVEEWVQGDHITLSRNPNYFRSAEGLPYLDKVVFRFTSGGPELIVRLLLGECDIGTHDADFEPFIPMLVQAEQYGLLDLISVAGSRGERVDLGVVPASDYQREDFFGDVRVRQAIAQCIDRQAMVDAVTFGHGVVLDGYLPPGHPLHSGDDGVHWSYDPVAGRRLLEEVGWLDEDEDGVIEAVRVEEVASGTPFEVTFLTPSESVVSQQIARIVRANLADCGIRLDLELRPWRELSSDGPEGPLFGRRFDLVGGDWRFDVTSQCERYLSSEIPDEERWHGVNITGFSDPDYDAVCRSALKAWPRMVVYEKYHEQAQAALSTELPSIPLFVWPRIGVVRAGVLNLALDATSQSELWNIEMIDVE